MKDQSQNQPNGQNQLNNSVVTEALPKGLRERIHRRTRKSKNRVHTINPEPVIKRQANNDPRRTAKGRANFKGSRKKRQDEEKRRQYMEAILFLSHINGKSMDAILEEAGKLEYPIETLKFIDILSSKTNKFANIFESARTAVISILDSRPIKDGPYIIKSGNGDSEQAVLEDINRNMVELSKYFDNLKLKKHHVPIIGVDKYYLVSSPDTNI